MPHKKAEHSDLMQNRASLTRFAWLSIGAALATIALKTGAYYLTGSVGLLSDAIESVVNLVGAGMALGMLIIAARPADESHVYGHSKAEYFASATEGLLILGAAAGIVSAAITRLLNPQPLEQLGLGLGVSVLASAINLLVARKLMGEGKRRKSISLEADAQHLMTDVWTSVGIIAAIGIVALTGWTILDPLIAILVALNIIWTGFQLVSRSVSGLMDASLPAKELKLIEDVMTKYRGKRVTFHALLTRQAAARQFVSVHVLVPGDWTVHDAHHIAEDFEADIRNALGGAVTVFTHLEPVEDELSMEDIHLDR
ncbi:MAG TPA: cation diffusion facilitator family transporter [Anaerolineales bacterium]|jgi:cation diffusion facilitator family transporter|nr:cation diffusion facilitator family transporter [Anaerolineales bacterium]HQX17802.1 cation diffusion facilitator family transporter [Anaerolineales bacterium]